MGKEFKNLKECLSNLNNRFDGEIVAAIIKSEEVGMSFEPRTQISYELSFKNKKIGEYIHTKVFEKDEVTLVCEFGKYTPYKRATTKIN